MILTRFATLRRSVRRSRFFEASLTNHWQRNTPHVLELARVCGAVALQPRVHVRVDRRLNVPVEPFANPERIVDEDVPELIDADARHEVVGPLQPFAV